MAEIEIILSAVEYLNTKPFIEGLKIHPLNSQISIIEDTPAECSEKLRNGRADIGIVPVADFPLLKGFRKITQWGIAADGAVDSVLLVSNQPVENLDRILLDYQSRTSNKLMRILAEDYFQIHPDFTLAHPGYEEKELAVGEGAVIIGDRALKFGSRYAYKYDLGHYWKELTGLPFVFAIWVANTKVNLELEKELELALGACMDSRRKVADSYQKSYPRVDVYRYLTQSIRYKISEPYEQGLDLFLEKIQMLEGIY